MVMVGFILVIVVAVLVLANYLILKKGVLDYLSKYYPKIYNDIWNPKGFKESINPAKYRFRYYKLQYLAFLTNKLALDSKLKFYINLYRFLILIGLVTAILLIIFLA